MPTTVFQSGSLSNTNTDLRSGGTVSAYMSLSSGQTPSAGWQQVSATLHISAIRVYSSSSPYFSMGGYGTTSSLTYNENVHSESLNVSPTSLLSSFTGGNMSFTLVGSTSGNLANVRDNCVITLTLNFTESSSTGTLSQSSVATGSVITLYIAPANYSYSHRVRWFRTSTEYEEMTLGAGETSSTFYVPTYWSAGGATVSLTTFNGSTQVGSVQTYSFSVTKSTVVAPTISSFILQRVDGAAIPSNWGIYVKGHSYVRQTATATATNATITSYRFTCGSNSATLATNTWLSDLITDAGNVACTVVVTDSNGNTSTKTETITVLDYSPPSLNNIRVLRCGADGVTSETGTFLKYNFSLVFSTVGGRNSIVVAGRYRKIGEPQWGAEIPLTPNVETIIDANLTVGDQYEFLLTATDILTAISRTAEVTAGGYAIFFKRGGQNVSVGMSGTKEMAFEINPDWDVWYGDVSIIPKVLNALSMSGGAMTGTISPLLDPQVRNIMVSASVPSSLAPGTVCLVYE